MNDKALSDKKRNAATRSIVRMTATEMGIRNTTLQVLWLLTDSIGYSTGNARISREKCMEKLGRSDKAIKHAFRDLRNIGIIYAIAYAGGGFKRSPVYRFRMHETAITAFNKGRSAYRYMPDNPAEIILNNGGRIFPQRGKNFPTTGEENTPPSKVVQNNQYRAAESGHEDAPSRGGMDKVGGETSGEYCRDRMAVLLRKMTYGEARYLIDKEKKEALRAAENMKGRKENVGS